MNKLYRSFKRNQIYINRAFLFLICVVIVYFVLPEEGRFGKDFEKNKPWKHSDLMAPFDFPIHKTEDQIKREQDSLLRNLSPYFIYDTSVFTIQHNRLNKALLNYLNDSVIREGIDTNFTKYILNPISEIYSSGILEPVEIFDDVKNRKSIAIVRNNIAEEFSFDDVYTQKKAYEKLTSNLNQLIEKRYLRKMPKFKKFLEEYNFNQLIEPNLFFDAEKTQKAKNELTKLISKFEGKIQEDERIISQGEVVDARKYQILESLKSEYESWIGQSTNFYIIILGKFIFVFISFLILYLFLYHFRFEVLTNLRKSIFIVFISTLFIIIPAILRMLNYGFLYYIIPFAILPIVVRAFYDDRLALFIHMVTLFIVGYFVPKPFEFIFLNFITGVVAIFSLNNIYRRRKIVITSVLIIASYSLVFFSLDIVSAGKIQDIDANKFVLFGINGLFILLVYPLIYVFEKAFGFLSEVTLMELSDTNQSLLRKLAAEAPGTFQHSLQVANLAEEAIYHIGGNTLLIRTGALYHDIGKMKNPTFFTENQKNNQNPHDNLESEESVKIIIEHVTHGVEIAKKNNLPEPVIDFIRTHHGTSMVRYFYKSFVNNNPGKEPDKSKFKYPGPIPYSKETAVLMMADSVEAASRSLMDINEDTIESLVNSIVDYQMAEDQFINADITFKDINTIKEVFKAKLLNIYHVRIQYPE